MALTLLMIAAFLAFLVVRKFLKRIPPRVSEDKGGFALQMTDAEIEEERGHNEKVLQLLRKRVAESRFFRRERAASLIDALRKGSVAFGRVNTKVAFGTGDFLTVREKKELGLNTRMKYSRQFIEYFVPETLVGTEPRSILENMHLDAFHVVARAKEIQKLRRTGLVNQVKLEPGDCRCVISAKKIYSIDAPPELPLKGCNSAFCTCWFSAVLPDAL